MDPTDIIKLAPAISFIPAIIGYAQYKLHKTEMKNKAREMEINYIKRRIKIHEILLERITKPRIEGMEEFTNSSKFKELANGNIQTKVNQFLGDHNITHEEANAQSIEGQVVRRFYWEKGQLNDLQNELEKEIKSDLEELKRLKNI